RSQERPYWRARGCAARQYGSFRLLCLHQCPRWIIQLLLRHFERDRLLAFIAIVIDLDRRLRSLAQSHDIVIVIVLFALPRGVDRRIHVRACGTLPALPIFPGERTLPLLADPLAGPRVQLLVAYLLLGGYHLLFAVPA